MPVLPTKEWMSPLREKANEGEGRDEQLVVCLSGSSSLKTRCLLIQKRNLGDQSHLFTPKGLHHCALCSPGRSHLSQ